MFNPLMGEELARLLQQDRQRSFSQRQRETTVLAALSTTQEIAVRQRFGFAVVRVGERIAGGEARPEPAVINS